LIPEGWSKGRLKIKRKVGMSEESKQRIGQKNKEHGVFRNLNNTEVTCPHCGKIGKNLGGMHRSHFNNCKNKT